MEQGLVCLLIYFSLQAKKKKYPRLCFHKWNFSCTERISGVGTEPGLRFVLVPPAGCPALGMVWDGEIWDPSHMKLLLGVVPVCDEGRDPHTRH